MQDVYRYAPVASPVETSLPPLPLEMPPKKPPSRGVPTVCPVPAPDKQ